jgi:pimeloyl-ACP methyl ester carboxylesterase
MKFIQQSDRNLLSSDDGAESAQREENYMSTVFSRDGTPIAFDQWGEGPAIIMVDGALGTRQAHVVWNAHLARHFSVFAYDRRGRGESWDTAPYTVEREVEDLDALIIPRIAQRGYRRVNV